MQDSFKKKNNAIVNSLNKVQIDEIMDVIFEGMYFQRKGIRRENSLDYPVPYVIVFENQYWANPNALSNTKKDDKGYPTLPFKLNSEQVKRLAPPSTTKKSSWIPRVPVHCVVWRWDNQYAEIPDGWQVSHLTDQRSLLSPSYLVLEKGAVNRARTACQRENWYLESKNGNKKDVRCPHDPVCRLPLRTPPLLDYTGKNLKPPGLPRPEFKELEFPYFESFKIPTKRRKTT